MAAGIAGKLFYFEMPSIVSHSKCDDGRHGAVTCSSLSVTSNSLSPLVNAGVRNDKILSRSVLFPHSQYRESGKKRNPQSLFEHSRAPETASTGQTPTPNLIDDPRN